MRNVPLVRIGNISALRDERVETKPDVFSDVYLMESRSVGGLSGAPVFIDILRARLTGKEITRSGVLLTVPFRFRLIGAISGHFKGTDDEFLSSGIPKNELEKLNTGIAYVTPAEKVFEGLQQFKAEEEEESKHLRHAGPLSIKVGDLSPKTNVSSYVVTTDSSEINREKN